MNENIKQMFKSPYLLIVPSILFYLMFWFFPVILSLIQSLEAPTGGLSFINYKTMFQGSDFKPAIINTLVFAFVSLIIQFFIALGLALLINTNFKGSKLFLFIMLIPMARPQAAIGIMWNLGLQQTGWINSLFQKIGLQSLLETIKVVDGRIVWKNTSGMKAVFLLILIDTWTVTPSIMIIILAGLQNFNNEYKEAALVFGANKLQSLKDIVIPIIKPSIITALLLRLISGLQVWLISVMIFGHTRIPFLLERVVYYAKVLTSSHSDKIAVSYSVVTLFIVLIVALTFTKVFKGKDWREE